MKIVLFLSFFLLTNIAAFSLTFSKNEIKFFQKGAEDTSEVIRLNNSAYNNRLTDPAQTIAYAEKALVLAKKLNYINGIAESYRIRGIGKYYISQNENAVENYLNALNYFKKAGNTEGEAKVYNNIGVLYRDVDYERGIEYFEKSLKIAEELKIRDLIAGLYLNMGVIYQKKKNYNRALASYNKSNELFKELENKTGLTLCLQNLSVVHRYLNQLALAEKYALEAIREAKKYDLNFTVASTNLTLISVYIAENRFADAEKSIKEGNTYSQIVKDSKLEMDYLYVSYELENKRKNYPKALSYLRQVYRLDSTSYKNFVSDKIGLLENQFRQKEMQVQNELTIAKQKNATQFLGASTIVAGLSFIVIFLLVRNNKKSAQSNKQLLLLNQEVSKQKEDLDRINHKLEDIIDERTKDLRIKNTKLSEYSWHLSHQIRGPVATLKGLMMLEKDQLIEQHEFMEQMEKCVLDIDNKIINISQQLNNNDSPGLNRRKDL